MARRGRGWLFLEPGKVVVSEARSPVRNGQAGQRAGLPAPGKLLGDQQLPYRGPAISADVGNDLQLDADGILERNIKFFALFRGVRRTEIELLSHNLAPF